MAKRTVRPLPEVWEQVAAEADRHQRIAGAEIDLAYEQYCCTAKSG